ncbi:MAG: 16S rRNA (guanine(527)-N(7))-methyltransferase RsmG [Rickettsiales bacterium]|nr:16S rRNA (guanine(527)-N(7))-methyltransferase RsmG [Rickettsiales bacterium]
MDLPYRMWRVHDSVFDDLNRHCDVSRETFDKLTLYYDLLLKWQARVNLIGPDTVKEVWRRHMLDSLQLLSFLKNKNVTLMDIGSGAGFPGMVLAIAGVRDVHLVESDQKKVTFLREVSRVTNTPVSFYAGRVERLTLESKPQIITARACSSLDTLCNYSYPHVSRETICLFLKGKNYSSEVENALLHWDFQYMVSESVTEPQGVVLKLTELARRPHEPVQNQRNENSGSCKPEGRRG